MWIRTEKVLCTEKDRNVLYKYGLVYTTPSYLMAWKLFGGNMCHAYVTNVHSKWKCGRSFPVLTNYPLRIVTHTGKTKTKKSITRFSWRHYRFTVLHGVILGMSDFYWLKPSKNTDQQWKKSKEILMDVRDLLLKLSWNETLLIVVLQVFMKLSSITKQWIRYPRIVWVIESKPFYFKE